MDSRCPKNCSYCLHDATTRLDFESVDCVVCYEEFKPEPKFVLVNSCGHSFCSSCSSKSRGFCLLCRSKATCSPNYSLVDAMEKLSSLKRKATEVWVENRELKRANEGFEYQLKERDKAGEMWLRK